MDAKRIKGTSRFATTVLLLFTISVCLQAQQPSAPQIRMRWEDFISGPDGAKRLASLKAGVAKMKSLDSSSPTSADYRRSWQYWANIHGYYGTVSPDGTVAQQIQYLQSIGMGNYVPYYTGITDQTPPDSDAQTIWATCQHSFSGTQANFFGWHRMYLYYFERVLRWAAGDDTLRLPYWDYTDPAQVALPAEFQDTASTLYDAKRDPGLNTGASTLNSNSTDIDTLLPEPSYLTYELNIEEGIHGYVHCTVGPRCPVAHMGDVPVAGNDPVFYSHHANIDRLWACWQNLHPDPGGSWENQQFSFVDETGTLQTEPVKNFLDSTSLGYIYDNVASCGRGTAPAPPTNLHATPDPPGNSPDPPPQKMTMLAAVKRIPINRPRIAVNISLPQPAMHRLLAQPEGAGRIELVLRDITAASHPGVLFDVYLEKKEEPKAHQFVGTISWFGAFRHHGHPVAERRTLQYEVTGQLRKLGITAETSDVTVSLEATLGRVPANPSKAEEMRSLAAKAFRPEAKLQIGAIELRQAAMTPVPEKR